MPLSIEQLIEPPLREEVLATLLDVLVSLGFPAMSWQSGSIQRTFFEAVSELGSEMGLVQTKLAKAGFESIGVEPTRVYRVEDARAFLAAQGIAADSIAPQVDGKFMSAFVRAVKPGRRCCG